MINKFIFKITLVLGCFVFLLSSCEDPNAIGFDTNPTGGGKVAFFTDSLKINMSSIQIDSSITSQDYRFQTQDMSVILMLGHAKDPYFGDINANAYLMPKLATSVTGTTPIKFGFDNTYTIDSIKLRFVNNRIYWGDTLKTLNAGVYRLTQQMERFKNYDKNEKIAHQSTPMATFDVNFEKFFGVKHDTTRLLEVKLPTNIIDDLLALKADDPIRDNQENFANFFKGFVLKSINNPNVIFGLNSNSSTFVVYGHKGTEGGTQYIFPLTGQRFTNLNLDRSGTSISSLASNSGEISSSKTKNLGLIQCGAGIYTKLSFPTIATIKNSIINNAVLELELDTTNNNSMFRPTYYYSIAQINENNTRQKNEKGQLLFVPFGISSTLNITGQLVQPDTVNHKIVFDISSLLQNAVDKNLTTISCVIIPASSIANSNGNYVALTNGTNLDRSFLKNPVLKLYYIKK